MDDTINVDVSDGKAIKAWHEEYDALIRQRPTVDGMKLGYLCLIAETLALTAVQNALILQRLDKEEK